jgi:hypothetical protein
LAKGWNVAHITGTTNVTLLLLANENVVRHHEVMNERSDLDLGTRILPGVDLTLWLRILAVLVLAAIAAGIAITLV